MAPSDLDDAIDRLYAAAPEEFVSERTRLAKELKKGGNDGEAAELAKLRKPTAAAWALNHTAREDPDAVEDWMDSAQALRDATASGGDGLREAMAANREATVQLSAAVRDGAKVARRPLSEPMLDRVRALLRAAAADEGLAQRVRAGRVTEAQGAGEMPALPSGPRPARSGGAAASRARGASPDRGATAAAAEQRVAEERERRIAELEHRVALAREEVKRRRADVDRTESAASAAGQRVEEMRRALRRSESEAEAARGVVRDAEDAAASAQRHLEELRELLHDAEG
jgi:hypothetical protein